MFGMDVCLCNNFEKSKALSLRSTWSMCMLPVKSAMVPHIMHPAVICTKASNYNKLHTRALTFACKNLLCTSGVTMSGLNDASISRRSLAIYDWSCFFLKSETICSISAKRCSIFSFSATFVLVGGEGAAGTTEGVKFVSLDLKGSRRTLNLMDDGPLLSMGIVDLYTIRLNQDSWQDGFQDCAAANCTAFATVADAAAMHASAALADEWLRPQNRCGS